LSPSPHPEVSVVVPTRDRPRQLHACLAALEAQTGPSFEIVVVDDRSADAAAVAAVVAASPRARPVLGEGRGPAAARNRGAGHASAPVLCFTDDDCRPAPGWLHAILRRVESGASAVAGPTRNGRVGDPFASASQAITNHLSESSLDPGTGQVGFAPTSNVACLVGVHAEVPFDETYPLAAGEDRDWCSRLAARGHALQWEPEAVVWHHQDLSLAGFWRQQHRYGRGAHHWHRSAPRGERLQPARFYLDLPRKGFREGPATGALVLAAQLATATGMAREALKTLRSDERKRP
jgi:glycosyltransferase involved in cell wall biosynthesis